MFFVLAFAKALLSCNTASQLESEIKAIPIDVELRKFHEEFSNSEAQDLPRLKEEYPMFFPQRTADSIWISKLSGKDTIYNVLEKAVQDAQFDYGRIEEDIENVMKHVVYYFPDFEPTPIVTVLSEVNYRQKVIPIENQLIVSIDTYLGDDHELYLGINKYQRENLNREQLPADVALAYSRLFVEPSFDRSLLGNMIYHGKLHYLQELFAPHTTGDQRFSFTPEKYNFTVENESQMWRYFVDNELIYKTDSKLLSRFILPAPFSKFYLEVDQQTPGGVGRYIGYRMVKSFMENNEVDIETMIQLNAEDIFERSKYKPLQ
ncbi:gliding motility protein [Nonlabens dokdonensis DSW-6]|uniref:Gliding motility protein n=2 Tax=Nonlabens dokdonensis TaxID=328515 RepID=L7W6X1_NONDD|nr:gliding motility protein [Nonlabens dokdonensis DSW-6]